MKAIDVVSEMVSISQRIAAIVKRLLWKLDIPYDVVVSRKIEYRGTSIEIMMATRNDRKLRKVVLKAMDCSIVGEWRRGEEYVDIDLHCNEADREALLDFLGVVKSEAAED